MPTRILIAERLRPFSSEPGVLMPLPGSSLILRLFPEKMIVEGGGEVVFDLEDVLEFTAQLDLEKGRVRVWGRGKRGYFRYRIVAALAGGLAVVKEKGEFEWSADFSLAEEGPFYSAPQDFVRLSLGSHKKQDWQMVNRRRDFKEILPIWNALAQQVKAEEEGPSWPVPEAPETVVPELLKTYLSRFRGVMAPVGPLSLLSEGAAFVRRLFVDSDRGEAALLPRLPPQFHCGRMLHVPVAGVGRLDLEWSKKWLKRVALYPDQEGEVLLRLQDGLKRFCVRRSKQDRGFIAERGKPLRFKKGERYLLDNFEK